MAYALIVNGQIVRTLVKVPQQMRLQPGEFLALYNPPAVDPSTHVALPVLPVPEGQAEVTFEVLELADALEVAKARKNLAVNAARDAANLSHFTYGGKLIAVDALSQRDIDKVAWHVARHNVFPPLFPNAWKAEDNSYVPLPDVEAWDDFMGALVMQGTLNFGHSQNLKAQIAAATTLAELSAIPDW